MPFISSGARSPALAVWIIAVSATLPSQTAHAGDGLSSILRSGTYDWRGPYAGMLFGLSSFSTTHRDLSGTPRHVRAKGRIAGIVAGYNFRKADLVFGPEADISYGILKTTNAGDRIDDDLFASLRFRLGHRFRRTLPYMTAGLAFHKVDYKDGGGRHDGDWQPSVTAGAGLEFAVGRRISARVEYLHVRGLEDMASSSGTDNHLVRASAAYHFEK